MNRSIKRWTGGLACFAMMIATMGFLIQANRQPSSGVNQEGRKPRNASASPSDIVSTENVSNKIIRSVASYLTTRPTSVTRFDPRERLRIGDPVFLAIEGGRDEQRFKQIGSVTNIRSRDASDDSTNQRTVTIDWYAADMSADEFQLVQYETTGRLSEVVATLLPAEKRKRIERRIAMVVAEQGQQLSEAFVPIVQKTLRESMPIVEAEFRRTIANHRSEIDAATRRWNDDLIDKRLIPLAKREILPIVRKHGQPPAEKIGREIWDRASLFRFGWRAVYDKSPLPKRDLLQAEWKRFVDREAVPVMERHMDEIVVAIQRSLRDIASNDRVRNELGEMAGEIASDPESRQLITMVLQETLVDNERLRRVWKTLWASPEAQRAFRIASDRLEPVVRQIGDEIFGSEAAGIDPQFARVLRSQILRKDRRWIVAWPTGASDGVIQVGRPTMRYPIVYVAAPDADRQHSGLP